LAAAAAAAAALFAVDDGEGVGGKGRR